MTSSSARVNINLENRYDRIVVLIDMDCFYCQVEEKLNQDLVGKPIAVVQYNAWRGGGIIAVNYPARAKGVTRHMRGEDAQKHCPEITLVRVPNVREKADLTKYREAGKKVAEILQMYTPLLERASVDEAYLDITDEVKTRLKEMNDGTYKILPKFLENTFIVGYETIGLYIHEISLNPSDTETVLPHFKDNEANNINTNLIQKYNLNLLIGSSIVNEIRAKVKEKTGYDCSAGIAHNKILAKLACGINKPNKQTILPVNEVPKLLKNLPVHKIKGLGGKFGEDIVKDLQIQTIGDLLKFSQTELQKKYDEKNGYWLFLIARGIDLEAVTPRFYSKSIGCCKKFPGKNAITGVNTLIHWLTELANEIVDRLHKDIIENNRKAKQMVVSFVQEINSNDVSSSRSGNLSSYDSDIIAKSALEILQKNTSQFFKQNSTKVLNYPIKFLGISVGKFENIVSGQSTVQEMFIKQKKNIENKRLEAKVLEIEPENVLKIDGKNNNLNEVLESYNTESISNESLLFSDIINQSKIDMFDKKSLKISGNFQESREITIKNEQISTLKSSRKDTGNMKYLEVEFEEVSEVISVATTDSINKIFCIQKKEKTSKENVESNNLPCTSFLSSDYTKTYAEYTLIQQTENNFVKCAQCGNNVSSFKLQTHLDGHLAYKLSQTLREEYRNELKTQISQKNTSNNNIKKINNSTNLKTTNFKKKNLSSPVGNIKKYLKSNVQSTINEMTNCVKCSECECFVNELKIFEHKDLHLAQKIQQEWNYS